MSGRLFDASAVVEKLLDGEVEPLFDEHVLDLTFYEAGNAVWKTAHLRGEMDDRALNDAVSVLGRLGDEMHVHRVSDVSLEGVTQIAVDDGLTFYDASYVEVSRTENLSLVTFDSELGETASGYVEVEEDV